MLYILNDEIHLSDLIYIEKEVINYEEEELDYQLCQSR
jgi:hypothetical protein